VFVNLWQGLAAMQQEIEAYGKPSVTENFEYVANQVSSELDLENGLNPKP
jgi:hypothetical protein